MDLKNIEFIEKNKPAIDEDIHLLNNQIKGILPDVYKEFLKITNGAVLNEYVFYSTKEMIEMYKCHDFSNNMPEYISRLGTCYKGNKRCYIVWLFRCRINWYF